MAEITKAQVKLVRSLQLKKNRDEQALFVAEGEKCVSELMKSFEPVLLIACESLPLRMLPAAPDGLSWLTASEVQIEQMSSLRTPQGVLAVFRQPTDVAVLSPSTLTLVLDGVQDPGNLGTIIRTADWFGVRHIICSIDTADCFNPKVVQATMGALARVKVQYCSLTDWLAGLPKELCVPVYGTLLDGDNLYSVLHSTGRPKSQRTEATVIVMGNEGNGISHDVRRYVTHPVRIPSFPPDAETSESLNVAIATAVVLAEFRRPSSD